MQGAATSPVIATADSGPSVVANNQIYDGTNVVIAKIFSQGPGWMAIHNQQDGHLGDVIGYTHVNDGENDNIIVKVDPKLATPVLYAMLHADAGVVGKYEFPGPDVPVMVNGQMVSPPFKVVVGQTSDMLPTVTVHDQDVSGGRVVIDQVLSSGPAWVAIHPADKHGIAPTEIGYMAVKSGMTTNVVVIIDPNKATPVLYAMLHNDAGEIGTYEYPGPDMPVMVNGQMVGPAFRATNLPAPAETPATGSEESMVMASGAMTATTPSATPAVPIPADMAAPTSTSVPATATASPAPSATAAPTGTSVPATATASPAPTPTAAPVNSPVPTTAVASPAPVATAAPAMAAMNSTPTAGAGETGAAMGGMATATTLPAATITPSLKVADQVIEDGMVKLDDVVSAGPGWIVIYTVTNGQPDQPIGRVAVRNGDNPNVMVPLDTTRATATLHAQLHLDAGKAGVFEYPGPDMPVLLGLRLVSGQFKNLPRPSAPPPAAMPTAGPAPVPGIEVQDQPMHDAAVVIAKVVSNGDSWLVIHPQNPDGSMGDYIGYTLVHGGTSTNVVVHIDAKRTSHTLYAMLHVDVAKAASPQFPGVDAPVMVNGRVILPTFHVTGDPAGDVPITVQSGNGGLPNLADAFGLSLYIFLGDVPGKSPCTGSCLGTFRPLLATGKVVAGDGVAAARLGVTVLPDGMRQVTYSSAPLYYNVNDRTSGDAQGQGINNLWFLVTP